MQELTIMLSGAYVCGLHTVGEGLNNWYRMLDILPYAEYPKRIATLKVELEELGYVLPLSEEDCAQTLIEFNTRHNIGVDFEEEDRQLKSWLAEYEVQDGPSPEELNVF